MIFNLGVLSLVMNVTQDLIKKVEDKVKQTISLIHEQFPSIHLQMPNLTFYPDASMGYAISNNQYYSNSQININPFGLLVNPNDVLEVTVPHEVIHLLTDLVYPNSDAHGYEWKNFMVLFGISLERPGAILKGPFLWKCDCLIKGFEKLDHLKIQSQKHICKTCKKEVIFIKNLNENN